MKCSAARKNIYAWLDGTLNGIPKKELEKHLKTCPDCRKKKALASNVISLLRLPKIGLPKDFDKTFWQKVSKALRREKEEFEKEAKNLDEKDLAKPPNWDEMVQETISKLEGKPGSELQEAGISGATSPLFTGREPEAVEDRPQYSRRSYRKFHKEKKRKKRKTR